MQYKRNRITHNKQKGTKEYYHKYKEQYGYLKAIAFKINLPIYILTEILLLTIASLNLNIRTLHLILFYCHYYL